jgi:EAL domain-containing protein (putative c-di-GMP-specific phosphodiesterase class I)
MRPEHLELELTESSLMETSREHSDLLKTFNKMGISVAIDDFGTGYSSLDYLRRFPVDRIKIAQVFVSRLREEPGNAAIVQATIGLARALGIKTIAEGVETREQLDLLMSWGCDEIQGFYFSRPLGVDATTEILKDGGKILPGTEAGR